MAPPTPRLFPGANIPVEVSLLFRNEDSPWEPINYDRLSLFLPDADPERFALQRVQTGFREYRSTAGPRTTQGDNTEITIAVLLDLDTTVTRYQDVISPSRDLFQNQQARLNTFVNWPIGLRKADGSGTTVTRLVRVEFVNLTPTQVGAGDRIEGWYLHLPEAVPDTELVNYSEVFAITSPGRTDSDGYTQPLVPERFISSQDVIRAGFTATRRYTATVIDRIFNGAVSTAGGTTLIPAEERLVLHSNFAETEPNIRSGTFNITVNTATGDQTFTYRLDETGWANLSNTVNEITLVRTF